MQAVLILNDKKAQSLLIFYIVACKTAWNIRKNFNFENGIILKIREAPKNTINSLYMRK